MVWPIQQPNNYMAPSQGAFPVGPSQSQQPQGGDLKQILKPQGQGLQSLLSPERISGLSQKLGNIQQVLNVVQKTAPIIQEYGPMIKNLPSLIKMMKTLGDDNADETEAEVDDSDDDTNYIIPEPEATHSVDQPETIADIENEEEVPDPPAAPRAVRIGASTPKLFI